ncbi:hypothetical protein DQ04_16021000 [Trypanosoma grayi]|uniref:hypothetical protein n=1 Tax=Trypanosoma grayi TaxID=71804 RepID=UPI0004F4BCB2|nr:hypothetical protein DQ04_16021000 [Trypanosoma grayi]KEG06086.1 hypothetical protein DQ04_16021000 [Trypanosoma grayi]
MRRCVSAAGTAALFTAWRGPAPAMGVLATRQSMCFHSSSKFMGRKSSGSKKLSDSAPSTTTTAAAAAPAVAGGDVAVAEKRAEDRTSTTTTSSNTDATSASGTAPAAQKRAADTAKRQRERCPRKALRSTSDRAPPPVEGGKDTTRFNRRTEASSKRRVEDEGASTMTRDEEKILAERASITKLFMVSDSVASIFCALPQDQRSIDNYLKAVDKAVIPKTASPPRAQSTADCDAAADDAPDDMDAAALVAKSARQNASTARREIAQRILSEERADHSLCIHVRDMEQLVPPRHLLQNPVVEAPKKAAGPTAARQRGSAKRRRKSADSGAAAEATATTSMRSHDQVLALQQWQTNALKKARESQERHQIPEDYHAITRVRFHDPHKEDLTVVLGRGGGKSVVDVLAAMNQSLKKKQTTLSTEGILDDIGSAEGEEERKASAVSLSMPFAIKPLLSVVASCIPRREPALGSRCGEETFFRSATATAPRRAKKLDPSTAAAGVGDSGMFLADAEELGRCVPPMPRFTTRVTVLVEHDELEPVDLLSMAERSTTRRDERSRRAPRGNKRPHIYCLIADGGEF